MTSCLQFFLRKSHAGNLPLRLRIMLLLFSITSTAMVRLKLEKCMASPTRAYRGRFCANSKKYGNALTFTQKPHLELHGA